MCRFTPSPSLTLWPVHFQPTRAHQYVLRTLRCLGVIYISQDAWPWDVRTNKIQLLWSLSPVIPSFQLPITYTQNFITLSSFPLSSFPPLLPLFILPPFFFWWQNACEAPSQARQSWYIFGYFTIFMHVLYILLYSICANVINRITFVDISQII